MDPSCTEHANVATTGDDLVVALLKVAPDPMIIIRDGGAILHVNAHAEQMFGYSRQELIGAKSELLFPVRYRNRHVAYRTAYFDAPRPRLLGLGMRLTGRHQDGTEFDADVTLAPFTMEGRLVVAATIRKVIAVAQAAPGVLKLQEMLDREVKAHIAVHNHSARELRRKKTDNKLFVCEVAHGLRAPQTGRQGTVNS